MEGNLAGNKLNGAIATSSMTEVRVKLGGQVVQLLVQKGFVGEDKWNNVILVGTKRDRVESPEMIDEWIENVVPMFFEDNNGQGPYATVEKTDYSNLHTTLTPFLDEAHAKLSYEKVDAVEMGEALAMTLGFDKDVLTAQLEEERIKLDAKLEEERAANAREKEALENQVLTHLPRLQRYAPF